MKQDVENFIVLTVYIIVMYRQSISVSVLNPYIYSLRKTV